MGEWCATHHDTETGILRVDYIYDNKPEFFFSLVLIASAVFLVAVNLHNKYRLQTTGGIAHSDYPVILPLYMMYIKSFVLYAILFGAWHLIDNMLHISSHDLVDALMGLEFGVLEFFIHTAALFLLSRGCGTREMIRSAWGGLAVFSVAFVLMNRSVHIAKSDTESELPIYFYVAYRLVLILMYIVCILLPTSKLYRRPSFRPYALMVITYCLIWIILSLSLHYGPHSVYCAGFFLNFIIDGLGPPLMLFVGARIDSKYWLGFMTTQNNPVAGAWELHVDTISTMATSISEFVDPSHGRDRSDERYPGIALIRYGMNKSNSASSNQGSSKRIVPMIHYGMINIDLSIFSAGAFARVYPATYQDRRVALKLLYTMELTPEFIKQFYLEAQTLNDLKHPNIVECIGVTVMPPAMGVLMEFCEHGSLYNFLYKRIRESFSVKDTLADLGNRVSAFHRSSVGRGNAKESSRATGVQALERLSGAEGSSSLSPIKRKSGRRSFVRSVRSAIRDDVSLGSRVDDPMSFAVTDQHFMADAIRGLAFLHEFGYMHCDIKSLNYLVDSKLRLKLSDFGESRPISGETSKSTIPNPAINWCPPELLDPDGSKHVYTTASDVFSLSMVLSEILNHQLPMDDVNPRFNYTSWHHALVNQHQRPSIPPSVPESFARVLELAWSTKPQDRPSAAELLRALEVAYDMVPLDA